MAGAQGGQGAATGGDPSAVPDPHAPAVPSSLEEITLDGHRREFGGELRPDGASTSVSDLKAHSIEEQLLRTTPGAPHSKRYSVDFPNPDHRLTSDASKWFKKRKKRYSEQFRSYKLLDWIGFFLPFVRWLRVYDVKANLYLDVLAGLSVAAMVVPQSLSYAKLAGLPGVYGLYGAFAPVLVYSALGSSRQLAVGPVAVTSLLLGSNLESVAGFTFPTKVINSQGVSVAYNPNSPGKYAQEQTRYNHAAIQVAWLAGVLYTMVGLLRLGFLINYLSQSVISGFMTAASIIIGLSQVHYLFGYSVARHNPVQEQLKDIFTPIDQFKWREFVMGMSWIILLVSFRELSKRVKRLSILRALGPLTVTVLSIAIVNIWHLENPPASIQVVGHIPKGLPGVTFGWWLPLENAGKAIGLAVLVCIIDLCESISIASALARVNKYTLDGTQELRGLGIANLVGAATNCYTTTGSFSRSAVNNAVGAKTQVAGFTTGITVMIVLLCLTSIFTNMPQNAQAAIVIAACFTLFDIQGGIEFWRVNKLDFLVWLVAFLVTAFAGVEIGIATAVGLSLILILLRVGFPHTAVLGRLPQTTVYRNIKQYPETQQLDGILIVRLDAPLYFANLRPIGNNLNKYVQTALARGEATGIPIRFIIIDLSPVTDVDASAVRFLHDLIEDKTKEGLQVVLANPSAIVVRRLEKGGIPEHLGREWIFVRTHDAVTYVQEVLVDGHKAMPPSPSTSARSDSSNAKKQKGGIQLALGRFKGWRRKGPKRDEVTPGFPPGQ